MISNRNNNNLLTAFYPSSDLIQHQRSGIRRAQVLTIKSSNLEFHVGATNPIHPQKIKRDLQRQTPILIRRHRPTIPQPADTYDVYGNQLHLILRSQSIQSKSTRENTIKQISKCPQTPIWSPVLNEREIPPSRPFRSKSLISRQIHTPHLKNFPIPDLFPSSRSMHMEDELFKKTTVKDLVDEWEDPKSNVAVSSDDDDSSIISTCNNPFASPAFIPNQPSSSSRRPYNSSLPPLVEVEID